MKLNKIVVIVYVLFVALALLAKFFDSYALMLFVKPLIIPSLFFYYFFSTNKLNILLCLFLIFCFIGDYIAIMSFDNELQYLMPPFFISNILVIIIGFKNAPKYKYNLFNIINLSVLSAFLIYLWYSVVDLFAYLENNYTIQIAVFGASLFLISFIAGYNLIWKINNANIYFMLSAACIMVSDIFYVSYNFKVQLIVLDYIHETLQMASYYLMIKSVLVNDGDKSIKLI